VPPIKKGYPHPIISTGKGFFTSPTIKDVMDEKKAAIISLHDDNHELIRLAESLDYIVVKTFIQYKKNPGMPLYVGKGKMEEVKEFIENENIECIIVNGILTPSQWYNMEKVTGIKVYDRIRLILDIFADRAKRKEARLQVKLAYLQYEKPYIRELIHRTKSGEHPGFMAGGEYQVADYYEMMKKQIKKIKNDLKKLERAREHLNNHRRNDGFHLVAITGYTNAGKSSLLNQLAKENVRVEEKLFSTLSTTTRRIKGGGKAEIPVLFTDTVGFIKELPHWLIDSFHSTLKEIELSDMIILLLDASDDIKTIREKAMISIKEISNINAYQKIIIGLNKADTLSEDERAQKVKDIRDIIEGRPYIFISARTGENIGDLIKMIYNYIPRTTIEATFHHTIKQQEIYNMFGNNNINILQSNGNPDYIIRITCSDKVKEKVVGKLNKMGAEVNIVGE